jgi:ribosomal-protein-alanine N-acetyltransferase
MSFHLEPLRYSDIPRCVELERLLYNDDDPWSEHAFRSELDFGNVYLGAFVDGEPGRQLASAAWPGHGAESTGGPGRQLASAAWPGHGAESTDGPGRQLASAAWPGHEAESTDGDLVGYAGMSIAEDASVHNIGVDPAWQRKGIGRALLVALLDMADERGLPVFLEVRTDNIPAITLYESHGFTRIGLRRKYYQPSGADAYTMVRDARIADEEPV